MVFKTLKIGTRGSALAMVQTEMVVAQLKARNAGLDIEIVKIETSGEWKPEQGEVALDPDQGGKGLFAKEIEAALLAGRIDCGVHSLKDMPAILPAGLAIRHTLPREDPRDAFLANDAGTLDELPEGAVVGTSGPRRQAYILNRRPDLRVATLRGNVPTRIEKLRRWKVDAAVLALSGLKRLGLEQEMSSVLEPDIMLPAAGQGAIAIETRENDQKTASLLDGIHCGQTGLCCAAERAAVAALDGSCFSPIGAYAVINGKTLHLRVAYLSGDGKQKYEETQSCEAPGVSEAVQCGQAAGKRLKARLPDRLS